MEEPRGSDGSLFTTTAEEDRAAWSQKTQSEAGDLVISSSPSDKDIVLLEMSTMQEVKLKCFVCVRLCACSFVLWHCSQSAEEPSAEAEQRNSLSSDSFKETVSVKGKVSSLAVQIY